MKTVTVILYIFTCFHYSRSMVPTLNISNSFTAVLRPGAVFFPQFVHLTSHIYSYYSYFPNGTLQNVYISEKDYVNPGDTVPKYQVYLNSETNYAYYVDGDNCTKTSLSKGKVSIVCLYIPSYISCLFLNGFIQGGYTFNQSYPKQCPLHTDVPCDRWYDNVTNLTIFANGNTLEVMLLSGILNKPMIYDGFKPAGSIPGNYLPEMECMESDEFPLCKISKDISPNPVKSVLQNLLHPINFKLLQK